MARFDKDKWIRHALASKYLVCDRSGRIWRRKWMSYGEDGIRMSAEIVEVHPRIHKKTGRVYFNMTYMGHTKSVLVNRVIALAFIPNPLNLPQVNHIDGNKEHNAEINLEWSSGVDNEKHAHRTGLKTGRGSSNANAKVTVDQVLVMRASDKSPAELAKQFGIARSTVNNILNRKTWSHI